MYNFTWHAVEQPVELCVSASLVTWGLFGWCCFSAPTDGVWMGWVGGLGGDF